MSAAGPFMPSGLVPPRAPGAKRGGALPRAAVNGPSAPRTRFPATKSLVQRSGCATESLTGCRRRPCCPSRLVESRRPLLLNLSRIGPGVSVVGSLAGRSPPSMASYRSLAFGRCPVGLPAADPSPRPRLPAVPAPGHARPWSARLPQAALIGRRVADRRRPLLKRGTEQPGGHADVRVRVPCDALE